MSKLHEVQVTGDKVEVVEWVGDKPDIDKHPDDVPYLTYVNDVGDYQRRLTNPTRYSTIESDRDYWLAKQGVFGEEDFEVVEVQSGGIIQGTVSGKTTITKHFVPTAIPRKEDDVWSEAEREMYANLPVTIEGAIGYLKQHFHLTRKNK